MSGGYNSKLAIAVSEYLTTGTSTDDIFNGPIDKWDVSNVTDMSNLFFGRSSFNENIGSWKTHNVTTMAGMFSGHRPSLLNSCFSYVRPALATPVYIQSIPKLSTEMATPLII